MNPKDMKLGLRVRVKANDQTAIIVGHPEPYTSRAHLVRIKYEFSTRYETMISKQLTALPTEEQFPAHGGSFERPEGLY